MAALFFEAERFSELLHPAGFVLFLWLMFPILWCHDLDCGEARVVAIVRHHTDLFGDDNVVGLNVLQQG